MSRDVTALAPWFGSNRMLAENVGEELAGCKWVGVPFAGGMCELRHIKAPTILVNDLHRHIINLARCAADRKLGPMLIRRLRRRGMHADEHSESQHHARTAEPGDTPDIDAAEHYFVAVWQGRSARAGMSSELTGGTCVRWTGSGGSSAKRYNSATESLKTWRKVFKRCDFVVMDAFKFFDRVIDRKGHGIYCDPPFPGPGDGYKHKFSEADHRRLAERLGAFNCRVVCRFYDHPLIRELYPSGKWTWRRLRGRDQANDGDKPELLLINGPSLATKTAEAVEAAGVGLFTCDVPQTCLKRRARV